MITLNFSDHAPPHFHVWYGECRAIVAIESGAVIGGHLPANARRMIRQWTSVHRAELAEDWERAWAGLVPFRIDPLE